MTKTALSAAFILSWLNATSMGAPTDTTAFGRFGTVNVYASKGSSASAPHDVALLLSGEAGWSSREDALARHLADAGSMVIGIDSKHYFGQLELAPEKCVAPSADLENLSHFIQSKAELKEYVEPVVIGFDGGGAVAYGALAEAPAGLLRGAIAIGFCPDVALKKPLCTADESLTPLRNDAAGAARGITLLPAKSPTGKFIALQADSGLNCAAPTRKFVYKSPGADLINVKAGGDYAYAPSWAPEFDAAFRRVTAVRRDARRDTHTGALPAALADLPLIVVPAAHPDATQWFGIFLSGDGGWVGLDKGVSKELAAHDIPIVGWDSLKYFWSKRTPAGTSADLDRVVRYYAAVWHKRRVLLLGYSQGADTLPFMINRLPPATHELVGFTTLIGISDNAVFEFHVTNWLSNPAGGIPTGPELAAWSGSPYLCLWGESDSDAACAQLTGKGGEALKLPGGHHFGGGYSHIASLILSRLPSEQTIGSAALKSQ